MSSDLVGTREAARLLGVSEASVRRWSDAGLLVARRVGQRGDRRFRRSDLLGLGLERRADQKASSVAVELEGVQWPLHAHLSSFYTSDAGRLRLGLPLLRDGILAGQPCVVVAIPETAQVFEAELAAEGVPMTGALEGGGIALLEPFPNPEEGIDRLERTFSAFTRRGAALVRVLGEAAQNRASMGSINELLRFEAMYDSLAERFPVVTLCQYDARNFQGAELVAVLKIHSDNFHRPLGMFLN